MNFIMIGVILRDALGRLCVRLNMYGILLKGTVTVTSVLESRYGRMH